MAESKLNDIIETALDRIKAIADSNTIIGDPIPTNAGTVIIPVSKVSIGFASGGADILPKGDRKNAQTAPAKSQNQPQTAKLQGNKALNFAGGGGTGISVVPVCFLVVKENGDVDMLNINSPVTSSPVVGVVDSISSFIDGTPDLISRFKDVFSKKKPESGIDPESVAEEIADLKAAHEKNDKK